MLEYGDLRSAALPLERHPQCLMRCQCMAKAKSFCLLFSYAWRYQNAIAAIYDLSKIGKHCGANDVLDFAGINHLHNLTKRAISDLEHVWMILGYAFRIW